MTFKRFYWNSLLILAFAELVHWSLKIGFAVQETLVAHCWFTLEITGILLVLYGLFWLSHWIDFTNKRKRPPALRIVAAHILGLLPFYVGLSVYFRSLNPVRWNLDWYGFMAAFLVLAVASGGLRTLVTRDFKKAKFIHADRSI